MLRLAHFAALGVLLAGVPAHAAEQQQAAQQVASSKPDPNEIVCKQMPPKIGTRLGGGRFCMARRAWDQEEALTRELKDDAQRRASHGPVGWW